jgi:hypothetical protein
LMFQPKRRFVSSLLLPLRKPCSPKKTMRLEG